MVRYISVKADERESFEALIRKFLTKCKPRPRKRRREIVSSSSSGEGSETIDPSQRPERYAPVGVYQLLENFRNDSLLRIIINYQTTANCPASVQVFTRGTEASPVVFFPRLCAAVKMNIWLQIEESLRKMCQRCEIPCRTITLLEITTDTGLSN